MAGPSVDVERAPDGWTHIGGPSMHLLIALDEEDERTLAASDAADGGDLDDVIEVLTAGGMRKARHFVGVHCKNETRIVCFGPVAATVTDADGTEREVRSTSARVWTDLELDRPPEKVSIRVLDEAELSRPVPPDSLTEAGLSPPPPEASTRPDAAELGAARVSAPAAVSTADVGHVSPDANADRPEAQKPGVRAPEAQTPVSRPAETPAAVAPDSAAGPPSIPTFGARSERGDGAGPLRPTSSPWGRSWATPEPTAVTSDAAAEPAVAATPPSSPPESPAGLAPPPAPPSEPAAVDEPLPEPAAARQPTRPADAPTGPSAAGPQQTSPSGLPSWGSRRPALPRRAPVTPPASTGALSPPAAPEPGPVAGIEPVEQRAKPVARAEPVEQRAEPVAAPVAAGMAPERVAPAERPVTGGPVDVESTWRPSADLPPAKPPRAQAAPGPKKERTPQPKNDTKAEREVGAVQTNDPPSYDYLFGHTVAADEHRRFLSDLEPSDDDEEPQGSGDTGQSSVEHAETPESGSATGESVPSTPPNPAPTAPPAPMPTTTGGLISSVPWASAPPASSPTSERPDEVAGAAEDAEVAAVPTFGGRRTPPPAPSLLPNNPPPGPSVSTSASFMVSGPPPAVVAPPAPTPPPATTPPPARPAVPPSPAPIPTSDDHGGGDHGGDDHDGGDDHGDHDGGDHDGGDHDADPGDHEPDDGLTIDRTALSEARNAAQQSGESGPTVLAVLCSAGHPTPPHSERCRVCAAGIPAQDPFTMPRPALGVLRLSTGDVVSLDRSVLLGRAPKLAVDLAGSDRPHVVKVPSPQRDVSRNHVEVVLEGWHVLIRDLGTTNGTTVALPGDQPVRLRANDQQVLEPGSLVSMADEISFTFEAGEGQ